MTWYTTADARRDAEKQAAIREQAGLTNQCSTFCAYDDEGRCAVTEDGNCDARRKGVIGTYSEEIDGDVLDAAIDHARRIEGGE